MDGVEENAATEGSPHGIVFSIVASRPPLRKIGPEFGVHRQDPPDPLLVEERLHSPEAREKPEVIPDHHESFPSPCAVKEDLDAFAVVRDWFLDEDIDTGGHGLLSKLK